MRLLRIDLHYDGDQIHAEFEQGPASVRAVGDLRHSVVRRYRADGGGTPGLIKGMELILRDLVDEFDDLHQERLAREPALWVIVQPGAPEYGPFKDGGVTPPFEDLELAERQAEVGRQMRASGLVEDA